PTARAETSFGRERHVASRAGMQKRLPTVAARRHRRVVLCSTFGADHAADLVAYGTDSYGWPITAIRTWVALLWGDGFYQPMEAKLGRVDDDRDRRGDPVVTLSPLGSGEPDVLAPWPFRPLPHIERDRLPFLKVVERGLAAGGIVKEVLGAVARQNEPEALVADEPLDGAVQ